MKLINVMLLNSWGSYLMDWSTLGKAGVALQTVSFFFNNNSPAMSLPLYN